MSVIIYHNPRCSKSRQALQLLKDRGIEPKVIEYLKTPPDKAELQRLLKLLHLKPRDLMRRKEPIYKEQGLEDDSISDGQLVEAMAENPVLIERPIVLANGKAVLGRPPEKVLEIINT